MENMKNVFKSTNAAVSAVRAEVFAIVTMMPLVSPKQVITEYLKSIRVLMRSLG